MPRSDDSLERLRAAIDELAAMDAADLLAEARVEARARVRATLTDALAHSMLERLHDQLPEPVDEPRATPPERETRRPAPSHRAGEPAWYVYGVVGADAELTGPLPGVDPEHPVTILREHALAAVTSQVPLDEFDEARLREHLADMGWVEATARAHETVLDRVCEQATVIPMRMCTVYRTEGGVREMLHRETDALLDALEQLRGKAEWGAKAFISLDGDGQDPEAGADASSGAAYMERKRTKRERRQRALEMAEEAVAVIHDRLSTAAADAQTIPLQRPEASGHSGEMILNGVYLVADESLEHFHEEVRALQAEFTQHGIELVCTGPWPAYNFVPGTIGAAW
jgi:Gas vesicle synthesis protein GvpL/GvpF